MTKTVFVVVERGIALFSAKPEPVRAGAKVEVLDLDKIAANPVLEFARLSREGRRLIADEHAYVLKIKGGHARSRCQNCERVWHDALVEPVQHVFERVLPGEPMPSGECPVCGAVCHPIG
jgi:hypothetical protein